MPLFYLSDFFAVYWNCRSSSRLSS